MIAAIGKQLKQSVNVFHNFMLYRLLPESVIANSKYLLNYMQTGTQTRPVLLNFDS